MPIWQNSWKRFRRETFKKISKSVADFLQKLSIFSSAISRPFYLLRAVFHCHNCTNIDMQELPKINNVDARVFPTLKIAFMRRHMQWLEALVLGGNHFDKAISILKG